MAISFTEGIYVLRRVGEVYSEQLPMYLDKFMYPIEITVEQHTCYGSPCLVFVCEYYLRLFVWAPKSCN